MIYILGIVIVLLIFAITSRSCDSGASRWLSKDTTTVINGFWILIVFLSHANPYINKSEYEWNMWGDKMYSFFFGFVGQMMVAMFLFNSGFGVMERIKLKGSDYIRLMPKHRVLTTLINFDIAVLCFVALNLIVGISMSIPQVILSLTCWLDVGNSNWYIFAILYCYIAVYVAFSLCQSFKRAVWVTIALIFVYAVLMPMLKEKSCWYNTIFTFIAGMLCSINKERLYGFLNKHWTRVIAILPVTYLFAYILIILTRHYEIICGIGHQIMAVVFTLIFATFAVKFDFRSSILFWCGSRLFPIYIYQRIPMISLSNCCADRPLLFVGLAAALTFLIAFTYRLWMVSCK